jgi:hypothetical protein
MTRKYFRPPMSASATERSSAADVGPCRASAAIFSEMSSIRTSSPTAFFVIQRRFGSAAVHLNRCSSNRLTVPSSRTCPYSLHQGV